MRPGLLLTIGAAVAAAIHVVGVLFARPVWRPAEVLATLCLLAYAVGHDLRNAGRWALSVAAAVLVLKAALSVPSAPVAGARSQWVMLSPEEYSGLLWRTRFDSVAPVAAALLFAVMLIVAWSRGPARSPGRRAPVGRRAAILGCCAAVVVLVWVVFRVAVIERAFGQWHAAESPRPSAAAEALAAAAAALLPLLLVLAALTLATLTAAHREWRAALGAALLGASGLMWVDAAFGRVAVPYVARDSAKLFDPGIIGSTPALPEPVQALTAALLLTAAILTITGLARQQP